MKTEQLPIGWKEIKVDDKNPHPMDEGTPPEEWKKRAYPRFPRKELCCWYRGGRYVRICQVDAPKEEEVPPFCVHSGFLELLNSDTIERSFQTIDEAVTFCKRIMRIGGTE